GLAFLHGKPSALAPFLYFALIFSVIFDWMVFDKLPGTLSVFGAVLVVGGGLIQFLKPKQAI
ncbi:MAG: hypothetical protein V4492_02880, partial [Chlamydiota bacterium]